MQMDTSSNANIKVISNVEPPNVGPNNESNKLNSSDSVSSNSNDSEEVYGNMYNDIVTELEVKEEQKDPVLTLEVYGIHCEEISCQRRFPPTDIFFCKHDDCKDDHSLYCTQCMVFKHNNKSHKFYPNKRHIKCANDFLNQNQSFNGNKAEGFILLKLANAKKVLWHHRWSWCAVSKTLIAAGHVAPIVNGLIVTTTPLIANVVVAGSLGGAAGAVIGFAVEVAYILRQHSRHRISTEEALKLAGISAASNVAAGLTFFGVMAGGAAIGIPGGPIAMTITAVVAAILFGVIRFGVNAWLETTVKKKNDPQNLQELALEHFFGKKNYDIINNKNKFSEEILRKKYHRLALNAHPDRFGGDATEWLKLSAYYGVLIGIWENKYSKEADISAVDDLSSDEHSLIINAEIKSAICSR